MIPVVVWGGAYWNPIIFYTGGDWIHVKELLQNITTYLKYRRENVLIILITNAPPPLPFSVHWLGFYKYKNHIGLLHSNYSTLPRIISSGISKHWRTKIFTKVWAVQSDTQTTDKRELEYNHIMACVGVTCNSFKLKLIGSTFASTIRCRFCISSCNL